MELTGASALVTGGAGGFGAGALTPERMGRADEYADLALRIAGNDYLNGTVIRIDGGLRFDP